MIAVGRGSVFLRSVASVKLAMLQWKATHLRIWEEHKLDSIGKNNILKKKKPIKKEK